MDSAETSETGKVEVTVSTSDSEELSDDNSPVQVSHSDAEESVILITKVITDNDSSNVNDEKTKNVITHNNVHENNAEKDLSEQTNPPNLNEQQVANPTGKSKEEENIEKEFVDQDEEEVVVVNNMDESISFKVEVIESDMSNNSTSDKQLESHDDNHEDDNSNKSHNNEESGNPINPNIPTTKKLLKDDGNSNLIKSEGEDSIQTPQKDLHGSEEKSQEESGKSVNPNITTIKKQLEDEENRINLTESRGDSSSQTPDSDLLEKSQEELKEPVMPNKTQLNNEGGSKDFSSTEQEFPTNRVDTTGSTKKLHSIRRPAEIQDDDNPKLTKSEHDIRNTEKNMNFSNDEEGPPNNTTTSSAGQSHGSRKSAVTQDDDSPDLTKAELGIISQKKSFDTEGDRKPTNFGGNEERIPNDNTSSVGQLHGTKKSAEIQDDDNPELVKSERGIRDQGKSSNTDEDRKSMNFGDGFDTSSMGQSHSRPIEIKDDDNPELIKSERHINQKKSSNTGEERKSMNFGSDEELSNNTMGSMGQSRNRPIEIKDDDNPELIKSERDMGNQKTLSNTERDRKPVNFGSNEEGLPVDLDNTTSSKTKRSHSTSRLAGIQDDGNSDLKPKHNMRDERKSSNAGEERNSMNFDKEQTDLFITRSTGQPRSTRSSVETQDDDNPESEHDMRNQNALSNTESDRKPVNFGSNEEGHPVDLDNTTSPTKRSHSTSRSVGIQDDGNSDLKKPKHSMRDERKSSNAGEELNSMNFDKEQTDLFITRSTGQPRRTRRSSETQDDEHPELIKSEHGVKSHKKSSHTEEQNLDDEEQKDLFNKTSIRQPNSTKRGIQGGDNNGPKRITDEEFDLFLKTPIIKDHKRDRKITKEETDDESDDEENDIDYYDNIEDKSVNLNKDNHNNFNHPLSSNNSFNDNQNKEFGRLEKNRVSPKQFQQDPNSWKSVGKNTETYQGPTHTISRYKKDSNTASGEGLRKQRTSMPGSLYSENLFDHLPDNNEDQEEGYWKKNVNRLMSGMSVVLNFGNRDDEGTNERINENVNEIRVIFHVHLPEDIEKHGTPVVLGDGKELGLWEKPIVKLHQPFPQTPTYWRSDPVIISLSSFSEINDIQYKYAIHISKYTLRGKDERIAFEGNSNKDNRTLDIGRNDQFDIWKNNYNMPEKYHTSVNNIRDFAFVDYIYNSIKDNNLKDKVMEYQHLLTHHKELTIRALNLKFITNRVEDKPREKRLFLCLLLGYFIPRQDTFYELPKSFPSALLLQSLHGYKLEDLPSGAKDHMYTSITYLVQNNAFQMKFDWLVIFKIAAEVDPDYVFIERLRALKYPSENLLAKFIKGVEMIRPNICDIEFETYVKLAKWLIQLCDNMDSLFKLWDDVLLHNNKFDQRVSKCFTDRIRGNISHDEAVALEYHFKRLSKDYRDRASEVFRDQVILLLENPNRKWTNENINSIKKLLHDNGLNWQSDEVIRSLELISQSHTLELLNIFPEILDDWFRSDFSDTREKKIPKICVIWFKNLLLKLDTNTSNKKSSNESNFIFSVFQQLELMDPLLGQRINIWRDLTAIAIDRVKNCSEDRIFAATKLIAKIKQDNVRELFSEMVKGILNRTTQQSHDQLLNKIRIICDCKATKILEVPNTMSEDILYHIMTRLQNQSTASNTSEHYLNILKASNFWYIILRATGSVAKLNSNPFIKNTKTSINELAGLLLEKTIDIQLLQQILEEYEDEYLFRHFDAAVAKKKALGDVIVSRDEIAKLRKICNNYQIQLDVLSKFYTGFCPAEKVTDVADYIRDVKQHLQNLDKIKVKQALSSDHWAFHEKTMESARNCYKFRRSQTFRNIFDSCIQDDAAATKVEYMAQKLIPIVFEKYNAMCKQLKDWEKLKCSEASLLWKNVSDVNAELDLMEGYKIYKSKRFVQTLDYLSKIPHWIQRLEELEKVVEMEIFKVPHNEDDWLSKSIRILKDDSMKLGQINNFFDYLDRNLSDVNQDCWKLIKELSSAEEFLSFLKKIAEHDIKNLINGVDDHSDERLIQEDAVSSLIQVKQFLFPLMNKNMEDISDLLKELLSVIKKNHTLGEKIALCNSSNMALQNMYNNIQNRGEVTKEKIKNAVLNGTFTFTRDPKEDKCLVYLQYPSKTNVKYNLNEILDLRGRALLIAKPKNTVINKEAEMSKDVMDAFVAQVDIAQEIINIVSMLIQMGHFGYRKLENKLQGTVNMRDYQELLKKELKNWQGTVDRAQQECYYLTFFPARHILAFYDYFTSEKLDKDNEEECKILIRFVNSKAQLPSARKDMKKILRGSKDYFEILTEIGSELERIFRNVPKQSRKLKAAGQRVMSDIVTKGKLFVAACTDKTRVPNIIMSLYANHGYYPEPWQLLICTSSTTMEELTIFIKRSFYASNNGYENHLFCIANLELLDFELQYNLVNQIRSMREIHDQNKDYLLALICCRETGMHHHILDQFSLDVHATNGLNTDTMRGIYRELCQNVIRVSSDSSGQGKTEWIKEASFNKKSIPRSLLISDGMEFGKLVRQFKECKLRPVESLHINIVSSDHPEDVNMFLFELLTLGIVSTHVDIACLPSSETPTHIFIEIASTTEQHLLNSLPMAGCLLFNHLSWNIKNLRVSQEINSPMQVACNYLNLLDRNEIDTKEVLFRTDKAIKDPLPAERCQNLIAKYFFNKNANDISSFRFVEIFINVLADQLVRLSSSQFFTVDNLKLMVKETNTRTLIVKTLIDVSKDFATRSIKTKEAQLESITADDENARLGTIVQWDDSNHLIVFFNSQTPDTISALYRDRKKVHDNVKILLKSQIIGDQTKWELDDYNSMSANALFVKLEYLARKSTEKLELPAYALSGDNLIKMALILLRARANIPVIVCGEAGCGKTSLIAYLAMMVEVQFLALNLHAGIDEGIIMRFMNDASKKAENGEIWLFFDEINTCNHIGLLADLISHRMLNGKHIHPNIRLFSACNPYRIRTRAQSEAGLTNKVKRYEEQSNLVYQVRPLPDQILDYVWDYGVLRPKDELKYIEIMVEKELKKLGHPVFVELLFASQKFIRKVEEPYSVSLRDVKRAITLVKFFSNSLENRPAYKKGHKYPPSGNPTTTTRSYVLALSLCYHSRLYDQNLRKQYRREMGQILQNHKAYVGENMFAKIIREEQEDYINRMQCPPNTANNEALLENVLVMIVCILTRTPLFLIGAPGSSKSLAIRLISSNLRGSDSNDKYFRKLPQIYLIPHQGSSSSTSDGIIKVFDKANKYQETTSNQYPVISVVLLDEVGLAETSPFNPLKVLHSLLEPSYPATGPTVSVIGISNWRLDNSKSSRALLVQRPQFSLDDLVDTAERLLNTRIIGYGQRGALEPLARAYLDYEKHGQTLPNFHGLRDYYALVKRLSLDEMTPENIQMALARNFGGTENSKLYGKYFGNVLKTFNNHRPWVHKPIPIEKLIDSNLDDPDARHLMVIGKSDSIVNLLTYQLKRRDLDPVVILGSQFPDDQDDYSYSVLSRIMMCVEAGRPLILTDLEIIYGSLYDLWNQNYIVVGDKENPKYFTRVALGAYANPMLYVSPNFKCILVMDEKNLASADPPLLNRFEKQKMSISDILNGRQKDLVQQLDGWTKQMSTLVGVNQVTQRNKFTQKDLFIGFDKDETLQSLVIDVSKNNPEANDDEIIEKCKECLIAVATSDGVIRAERSALERDEINRWKHVYFHQQHHDSLYDYFVALFNQEKSLAEPSGNLVIVNTFSNINTDINSCLRGLLNCQVDKLSTFKTEAQLTNRVKHFWLESADHMLILQCDVTTINAGCVKLAKYIIEQYQNEFITKKEKSQIEQKIPMKHACIILHIHRDQEFTPVSFNFMCGWKQVTIETLSRNDIPTSNLLDGTLSDIINSTYRFEKILQQEMLWCLLCMKYPSNDRSVNHIKILSEKILNYPKFIECFKARILEWIDEKTTDDWQYKVASNKQNLYPYASFSLALQAHVRTLIRIPMAKILCALERLSATKTFFYVENDDDLFEFWQQIYKDKKIIKIDDLPDPKPDGYIMPAGSLYDLKFPFSLYFMKQIDNFKRHYEEEIALLQQDEDRVDRTTNELYDWVIEDHLKDFKNNILTSIPQLRNSPLERFPELYFNDFVTVVAANDGGSRNTKMLTIILKLLIGADKVYQPILLHTYWWKNANEVLAQLQLALMAPTTIQNIEIRGTGIIGGSFEKYLVKEITKMMFERICGNLRGAANAYLIDRWQHDVTKVLSLGSKVTRAKNLPALQLLRIVNDLVASKSISLDSVKEIVQLGLSADRQEILSEKFVNTVLDKLDKLEQNEKNLIPKRSFIMRCLGLIPIESNVRLFLYKKLFSNEPFSLMGAIVERIFLKEDAEQDDVFFTLITNPIEALRRSKRLNIINNCLKDLDTNMATLCCDIIEQAFFMNDDLTNLEPFFGHALEALYREGDGAPALQKITSIAYLKEFVRRFWDSFIQEDRNRPIAYNRMEEDDFDSAELINQINNYMNIAHPLIYSLKMYFLRDLRQRDFSIDDVRKFCEAQQRTLPWLGTLNWEDVKDHRLTFNPYCNLPEYNEAEKGFMIFYGVGNRAPFQEFIQNIKKKPTLTAKLTLFGLYFVRLHAIRASREWRHPETQSAEFVTKELAGMNNFPVLFKTITTKILSNKQPLLQIYDSNINNTDLILKSVIAHIIAFHASVEPNSSQLAMYLHRLQDCQNLFILTCTSDSESVVLNAVAAAEGVTRYACKCGMKYVIANCGGAVTTSTCPNCKSIIGGTQYTPAAGNTRIDSEPIAQVSANDQAGYIGEPINLTLTHSVRSLPPTSYRILHLIVHALIGASSPQSLAFLRKNNQNATDAEKYCMDHIRSDWAVLKNILNCSDENLALMFHSLISSMTEKPLPNQQIKSSADRENWETEFHRNYIAPQTRNITETATNYRMKLNAALTKIQKNNVIEGEINQTLVMDKQYRVENLPALWRSIGLVNFESFRAYYMSDLAKNKNNYPFLSIFFKYAEQLELLKHLLPIVKFVQILNSKLGYQLTRQKAREMSFRQFIEKESNEGENREIFNSLKTAFDDFAKGWNTVLPFVKRYQCHELPREKPNMAYKLPVVFGLMEPKDTGILLCAILDFLVNLQNKFLGEIMSIPPGACKSLKFLDEPTFNVEQTVSSTSKINTPSGYYLQSMRIDHARSANIINFDWDDEILAYSQRNLAVAKGQDIIYDLTKIEAELANILVFEKVHIETQPESQLYLEPFPYHMELFQGCMRILSDIKNLITQEPIPADKMNLLGVSGLSSSFMFSQEPTFDNASEILSSLEILLCFVKRTAVGDGEIPIKDYISRWMKLSSLSAHEGFSRFLNIDLRLKHLVALYEFVEEQVANLKIKYIHDKYKAPLSVEMRNAINQSVDFEQQTTTKEMIPAEAFAKALKRFMLRFLTLENQKEMEPLYVYLTDNSLNFWPSTIPEERIDALFPDNLMVANTYEAYEFTMNRIENTINTMNSMNPMIQTNLINPINSTWQANVKGNQRNMSINRNPRKPRGGSRFDVT
ncbi:hypothetical protein RclHR1_00270034 [Rhizophagus clarus]|uniref:RZ-type domain-containing protein n=1 Tax=Rhizophagus clarus TaxID=94130 RepID=A0A2Z6RW56_9GLOM|nr:hypothetical protein RclHR1_00270034 [Rhizophagus clarus]